MGADAIIVRNPSGVRVTYHGKHRQRRIQGYVEQHVDEIQYNIECINDFWRHFGGTDDGNRID
jgi:hypothetical protein